MSEGYIYILKNPLYKDNIIKIGKTGRSPKERSEELSRETGVPGDFEILYKLEVSNCNIAEKLVHEKLKSYRIADGKEFFRLPISEATNIIVKVIRENNLLLSPEIKLKKEKEEKERLDRLNKEREIKEEESIIFKLELAQKQLKEVSSHLYELESGWRPSFSYCEYLIKSLTKSLDLGIEKVKPDVYRFRSMVFNELGRKDYYKREYYCKRAKTDIEKFLQLCPKNAKGYKTLGKIYEVLGHYDMAKKYFKEASKLGDNSAWNSTKKTSLALKRVLLKF